MHHSGFFGGVGFGIVLGAAAAGLVIANRDAILGTRTARAIRSVGHTVGDAAEEIVDTLRM